MPRRPSQNTHRGAKQQSKHNQHTDGIQGLAVRNVGLAVRRRQMVHGDDRNDEQDEDDGGDKASDQRVNPAAAVQVDELVGRFGAQLGGAEQVLQRGVLRAKNPLQSKLSAWCLASREAIFKSEVQLEVRTYLKSAVELAEQRFHAAVEGRPFPAAA
jgi:hypothetical protein